MDRARQAEFLKAVAAGPLEDHLVAVAAGRLIDDAGDAEPVDRDEAVDVGVIAEQRLHAPEIAELLLADGADEHHVADGAMLVGIHRLDQRQQRGEPARIVADAGREMAPSFSFTVTSVPSGNTVSRCAETTSFGLPPPLPLRKRDHIAFGVDRGVLEAELLHPLQVIFGPDLFLERRRRNFGDALLLGKAASSSALMSSSVLTTLGLARMAW
jgi:hypothetical protein